MEENPFEDELVAQEWIRSVEGEKGLIRDNEIYPLLKNWSKDIEGTILDIGSGQGVASEQIPYQEGTNYVGVEPSVALTNRAVELYTRPDRKFIVGNAYELPVENESIGGCFSITVWFHLENLDTASQEIQRVLKPGGKFLIITTNPEAYPTWEDMYTDVVREGKMFVGKAHIPVNPLSRNTMYQHSKEEMKTALLEAGLEIEKIETLGKISKDPDVRLFIAIFGKKK